MRYEGEQGFNLVNLYNRYNRERTLEEGYLIATGLTTLAILGLTVMVSPDSYYDQNLRPILPNFQRLITNLMADTVVIGTELGVGFVGWKRSQSRREKLYLQIAEAEGREVDETNERRIRYTSDLASTLVYGIKYKPTLRGKIVEFFSRPTWELGKFYGAPEERKKLTFDVFDGAVNILPFDHQTQNEVGLAALTLAQQKWEIIRNSRSGNRVKGYSYVMLTEINKRLDDIFPQ